MYLDILGVLFVGMNYNSISMTVHLFSFRCYLLCFLVTTFILFGMKVCNYIWFIFLIIYEVIYLSTLLSGNGVHSLLERIKVLQAFFVSSPDEGTPTLAKSSLFSMLTTSGIYKYSVF